MSANSFFRRLMTKALRARPPVTIQKAKKSARLRVEAFEDRITPTNLTFGLFDTARDSSNNPLPGGAVDSHYTIPVNPNGGTTAYSNGGTGVTPTATPGGLAAPGNYTYRTTFDLRGLNPSTTTLTLTGFYSSDDNTQSFALNGNTFLSPNNNGGSISTSTGFVAGVNTLDVVVNNQNIGNNPTTLDLLGLDISVTGNITYDGTVGNDLITVTATGPNSGTITDATRGVTISFTAATGLTINGLAGNDVLTVNYAGGNLGSVPITFNGGGQAGVPGDTLNVTGGSFASGVYTPTGPNSGTITHVGGATGTAGLITFTGLEPVTDTTAAANFTINATAGADAINVVNGAVLNGFQTIQVNSGAVPTFELVNFANKTNVTIDATQGGADTVLVNYTTNAAGLASLTVNTGALADTVNVTGTVAAVVTNVNAGGGLDTVNVGNTGAVGAPGLLTPVAGTVIVDGQGGGANLTVDGSGAAVAADYQVTNINVVRVAPAGFGGVQYANLATLLLTVGGGNNVISVPTTSVPTTINTNAGVDTINVGRNAVGGTNTLAAILGPVTVNGGGQAGDAVNLFDQTSGAGQTYGITATQVTRSGAQPVTYSGVTALGLTATNFADTLNVQSTAAGVTTAVNLAGGSDTANVSSDAPTNAGNLDAIDGPLTLDAGPAADTDVLNISEDGGGADTVLVNLNPGNTISGTAGGGWTITRGPGLFDSINLTNSANVDTVNVRGTAAGEALNIEGNGGYDTVNLGSLAPTTTGGVVANIAGPVSVSNNPSLTHVVIDDSGDATARTITVNANQVTVGAATVNIDPPDLYDLVVNAGQGNDTIDVNSTRDAATVNGGGGQDTFNLNGPGFADFSTNNFNGGDEAGSTGDTFNYTPITNAQASYGVEVNINGNNPVAGTSPGDTLNVNANGNGVTITPTSVAVNGSPPINFSTIQNIETFLFVNAGPVTVNGDAANNVLTVTSINPATNRATVRLDTPPVTGPVITLDGITQLTFNAAAGNDRMDVDQNGQLFNFPMTYFGGTQTGTPGDTLRVINYNLPNGTVTVTHNPNNAGGHNGTVQVGAGQPTISFNELEPLALAGTAANLVINLPAATAADNVLLANDGPVNFPGATGDAADDLNTSAIGDNGAVPGFEFTQFTNPTASLTVNMGANNYRMRVRAMDALFAAQINVNGQANSADTLGIDYASGVVNETINFNGGGGTGNNLLTLVSVASAPIGGPFPNLRETVFGNGNDAGVWYVDPNGTAGPGAPPALFNGDETTLNFQNTQVLESTITAAAIDYVMSPADNVGTLLGDVIPVEGSVNAGAVGVVPGVTPADRLRDDNGSFADLRFVNAGVVRIMGSSGNDAFRLATAAAAAPAGLTKLEVYGHVAPDINPAAPLPPDDNGSDVVDFIATHATAGTAGAPAFVVNAFGQGGSDLFTNTGSGAAYGPLPAGLTAANVNNMRLIRGTVTIDGGEQTDAVVDADEIAFDDFNNTATAVTALLTSNKLTGAAPAIINYTAPTIETFYYGASALDDTIDITSTNGDGTAAGTTTYLVSGNGGGDVLTVGNTRANFEAPTFNGDLTAIRGPLQIAGDRTGGTGTNTLNVDASGQATAIANGVIDTVAGQPFPLTPFFGNFVEQGQSTNLTGFAPAQIGYYHNAITSNAGNRFATVNVRTTPLADTIIVFATTASDTTTLNTREGDDLVFVQGDNLSANNVFQGFDGNDDTRMDVGVNVGANPGNGNGGFAIQSVLFDGQNNLAGTAGTTANRDRLTINDFNNTVRDLNFQYLASQGGVDILGGGNGLMGGAGTDAVNVRAMETLVFNDVFGFNNDNTTLTGTAGDDVLTVAQLPGAANVFLGGAPYTSTPPVELINPANRPGLSGGGTGTDMYIGGISTSPFPGLRVTGGGFAAAGDQLVVYAASELALNDPASAADAAAADTLLFQTAVNPLAFAAGDLVPAFGAFNAYDQIDVSDARVITFNNAFGLLTTVNVDTLSFVQAPPATSAQRPALVVNGGDEAVPQLGTGVADLFFANISPFFNIVVNGNLPLPPNPTPQPPFPIAPLPPNGDA
ncbi:MAG: hypothetical protein K2P78_10135, partial [Gemmataceae bacterium]|nr:hypothetical protein [Gemmataceae bacterium]